MKIAVAVAMLITLAPVALADTIVADATGKDSSFTTDFWGVDFVEGDALVKSVTFDLSADWNAYFDFDGSSFQGAKAPVIGALSGLTLADITVKTSGAIGGYSTHPSLLSFSFAKGSFASGDSFRFSADTDALGFGIPDSGSTIGDSGVMFNVLFEDGRSFDAVFETQSNQVATAVVPNPEPGTWVLMLLAFSIFVWRARRLTA